ncbi:MAG: ABC transporter permease [Gammaproteobacteria bacterium]|nr:ABC transporter permease [Gammaproteobacteria bacterium]
MYAWTAGVGTGIYATVRMLVQLLAVGFVLVFIFESESPLFIAGVLAVMLLVASSIAVRPIPETTWRSYGLALIAITLSSVATLALVTQSVIGVEPWFSPRYIVPLAGMIIAGAMNAISLAGERMHVELSRGEAYEAARRTAFKASIIPITNSLFAVGIVALPGMMTGQILSGVSPLVAVKYQIVVMNMLFGATGAASALYLVLCRRYDKHASRHHKMPHENETHPSDVSL